MIRTIAAIILSAVSTLSLAGEIRLEWSATSGGGGTRGSDISAITGDILALDVIFDNTLTEGWAAVSLDFSAAPLALQSVVPLALPSLGLSMADVEANAGSPALFEGTGDGVAGLPDLVSLGSNFFSNNPDYDFDNNGLVNFGDLGLFRTNYGAGSPVAPSATNSLYLALGDINPGTFDASQLLATLTFEVMGPGAGNINPFFNTGVDGVFDNTFQELTFETQLAGATLNGGHPSTVPLPGTLYIMTLCLFALTWSRRPLGQH